MTKQELKTKLHENPGYLKSGSRKVASLFKVSRNTAKEAIKEVKEEKNNTTPALIKAHEKYIAYSRPENLNPTPVEPILITSLDSLQFVAKELISLGKITEAIDILNGIKTQESKPRYIKSRFSSGEYFVIGCSHLPFHNKKMWEAQCKLIADCKNLKGIVLAGDILDMHSISRHSKGQIKLKGYDLAREYKEANEALDLLDKAIGDRVISKEYFYGNHEDWWNQWGKNIDNNHLGTAGATSPYEACFKHRGYRTQFNWKTASVQLGDLEIIHGEWCNKHSAHKHATELHRNVAFFHTHRMGTYFESNIQGMNCGWGGDKTRDVFNYMSKSQKENWRNGFLHVYLDENNRSYPTILDFKEDHFYFNGKLY